MRVLGMSEAELRKKRPWQGAAVVIWGLCWLWSWKIRASCTAQPGLASSLQGAQSLNPRACSPPPSRSRPSRSLATASRFEAPSGPRLQTSSLWQVQTLCCCQSFPNSGHGEQQLVEASWRAGVISVPGVDPLGRAQLGWMSLLHVVWAGLTEVFAAS